MKEKMIVEAEKQEEYLTKSKAMLNKKKIELD